jgi:nucleotide-binding universal stress UspA family protein
LIAWLKWGIMATEKANFVGLGFFISSGMKKILVPSDLSPTANIGLKLAVPIAQHTGAVIHLVNFTKHPITTTFTAMGDVNTKVDEEEERYILQLLQANRVKLQDLVDEYKGQAKIEFSIVDDDFRDGIDEYLEKESIDLIVMGTSGEENLKEIFTGNHTEQAIQVSSCPVLSVRDGFSIQSFRNIVVAVSCIDDAKIRDGLGEIYKLAAAFKSTVHIVHVVDPASDSPRDMNNYFSSLAVNSMLVPFTINILEGYDQVETVMQFAHEIRGGLIAVIKQSPKRAFRIFSSHFSERIIKKEGRPVFTVNTSNKSNEMKS